MRALYGDDAQVIAADEFGEWLSGKGALPESIVPWGWDARLKRMLQKQGCPDSLLPDDETLSFLRQLQHRSTISDLQPHAVSATSVEQIECCLRSDTSRAGTPAYHLNQHFNDTVGQIVLKAPWSGAGRGVRFVDGKLSDHDRHWAKKVISEQRCVIVERRLHVKDEFALEYYVEKESARQIGLSLFVSQSGVYKQNILISDDEIRRRVNLRQEVEDIITDWIITNVVGKYEGPLGVDLIIDEENKTHISEFNFRHTMGMVAHETVLNNKSKWD